MKKLIVNYSWAPGGAGAGTVTFTDYATIRLDAILLITNVTGGIIIFNASVLAQTGTVATNVLTLTTSTTGQASGDKLEIWYDDGKTGEHRDTITVAEYNTTAVQTNDDMLGAIAAGTRVHLVGIDLTVDEATTVGVDVRIGFGAASVPTEAASGATAVAGVPVSYPGIPPGGGITKMWPSDKLPSGALGEELRITNSVPTGGKLTVVITYFTTTD